MIAIAIAAALTLTVITAIAVRARSRLLLTLAKQPSLAGHARLAKRLARLIPFYEFDDERFFQSDGAPSEVVERRQTGFFQLARQLRDRAPETIRASEAIEPAISDLQFTGTYRVPFQYRRLVRQHLKVGVFLQSSDGVRVRDLDGNEAYDLAGSYGVNVFGYDFYKTCIDAGLERVRALGPLLGSYHPVVEDNVRRLQAISGLEEVSFHMSGTEAVMQAVRLARYHTGRTHLVQFSGAYHGWWDGVQPGVGNPRPVADVYVLKDMHDATLRVLQERRDIACVLVNPLQMLHPNAGAPGDGSLIASAAATPATREAYTAWLQRLRAVCTDRGIVLILDEVFMGFRLAYGGAQEYFGVRADMVTYGKTVGGGLPIGVLCGQSRFMKRFHDDRPADICFARGTFNAHPYVMGAMNEFLLRIDTAAARESYASADAIWNARAAEMNSRLAAERLPIRVANLCSVWTIRYVVPSRYHWMFQYYLRAQGLSLSWVGSGRLIFSHNYSDTDFAAVRDRVLAAAVAMREDGWWYQTSSLNDRAINRQVLREMLAARLGWPAWPRRIAPAHAAQSDRTTPLAERTPGPFGTAARRGTGL